MFKVMIIDDEWLVREGLKTTIAWHEMQCEIVGEADNGIDALKLIDELSPDILLSDIRMPGMDGLELVQTISRRDSEITTIFLTGFDDFSYAQQAVKLGAFDILLKPSDPHELRKTFGEATRMITLRRQQMDYTKILEKHQRTSQPFVLEKVLQHLLTDTASMQDMQLLYEALEGFLEPFEAFRVAVVDFGGGDADALKEPGWESGAAAYFRSCALTDPIPMNSGVYAVLLSEVGGS
ncbi:response regulator, partial [Paenibacillus sepulcri]|nr:response regulator [Paenibacillus sepulcri]